jgi:hypothetical protein
MVLTVKQPYASCFFKARKRSDIDERKDIEIRGWDVNTFKRDFKFAAITSGKPCSKRLKQSKNDWTIHTCYKETTKELAAEQDDDRLLIPLQCQAHWDEGMHYVRRNGGRPDTGFPFSTIEGILLFEGELTQEEKTRHNWWVPGYGSHAIKVKKVIRFSPPIHKVLGCAQGKPKALYKTLYLGADCQDRDIRSQTLRQRIFERIAAYI